MDAIKEQMIADDWAGIIDLDHLQAEYNTSRVLRQLPIRKRIRRK